MSSILITNIDETPVRRYGNTFNPGETVKIDTETISAYSLMEISRNTQSIARSLRKISGIAEDRRYEEIHDNLNKTYRRIVISNASDFKQDPWVVRKINAWKIRRRYNKQLKARNKEAKPCQQ